MPPTRRGPVPPEALSAFLSFDKTSSDASQRRLGLPGLDLRLPCAARAGGAPGLHALVQRQVRPCPVIVAQESSDNVSEVRFAEHDGLVCRLQRIRRVSNDFG